MSAAKPSSADLSQVIRGWFAVNVKQKGVEGLRADFVSLKKPLNPKDAKAFLAQPAGTRNRYRDVVCLDASRVVLKGVENDYIHANYVSTPQNEKRFICTQGPTPTTCTDFWHMMWQEKCNVVLMLCNLMEKQIQKCAEYFPAEAGQSVSFDNYKITCTRQSNLDFGNLSDYCFNTVCVRVLEVSKGKEKMTVEHYHWVDWPDRGVPKGDLTAVAMLNKASGTKKPIVVHCSAGIGRTGSIVMLQYILELYQMGRPCENIDQILAKIREQRALSVQYLYVVRVILEYFYRHGMFLPAESKQLVQDLRKFVEDYNKATGE